MLHAIFGNFNQNDLESRNFSNISSVSTNPHNKKIFCKIKHLVANLPIILPHNINALLKDINNICMDYEI